MWDELFNPETLLKISANLAEVVGITSGLRLIVGSAVMRVRKFGRAKQWAICGLLSLCLTLALPGFVNLLVSVNSLVGLVAAWAVTSVMIVFGWHSWWLPWTIARKADGRYHPGMFFFCLTSSTLSPLMLAWPVVLYMATGKKNEDTFAASSAVPPVIAKIYTRFTTRRQRKVLGCGHAHLATAKDPIQQD